VLAALEGRGDARRDPDRDDRRRRRVSITPRGRRTLDRLMAAFEADEDELLAALTAGERRQLRELATRVLVTSRRVT